MRTGESLTVSDGVQRIQTALHAKAKEAPGFRFYSLSDKVWRDDVLAVAWQAVRRNGGAAGVDGETVADIDAFGVERWLGALARDLKEGTYRPHAVRQVLIPKKQRGKFRPLGIPGATHRNIYVRSRRAGERVMASVTNFLARRLKLTVNAAKSAVDRPAARAFLAFSFTAGPTPQRVISPKALARFKVRVRALTRRTKRVRFTRLVAELSRYLVGWRGYFGFCEVPYVLLRLDQWTRRRLRAVAWTYWKRGRTRFVALRRRGVSKTLAAKTAGSAHGPWRVSLSPALCIALPNAFFDRLGLASVAAGHAA